MNNQYYVLMYKQLKLQSILNFDYKERKYPCVRTGQSLIYIIKTEVPLVLFGNKDKQINENCLETWIADLLLSFIYTFNHCIYNK